MTQYFCIFNNNNQNIKRCPESFTPKRKMKQNIDKTNKSIFFSMIVSRSALHITDKLDWRGIWCSQLLLPRDEDYCHLLQITSTLRWIFLGHFENLLRTYLKSYMSCVTWQATGLTDDVCVDVKGGQRRQNTFTLTHTSPWWIMRVGRSCVAQKSVAPTHPVGGFPLTPAPACYVSMQNKILSDLSE